MLSPRHPSTLGAALLALCIGVPASAQPADGRLTGVVRDVTGATVPGAAVTATNAATNAAHTASSGPDGSYSLSVPAGAYTVTVALRGFGRQTKKGIEV